jgi:hypothetical protein
MLLYGVASPQATGDAGLNTGSLTVTSVPLPN